MDEIARATVHAVTLALSADAHQRSEAEAMLSTLSKQPGFVSALLYISLNEEKIDIRHMSAIFLKNYIVQFIQNFVLSNDYQSFLPAEQNYIKDNIIQAMTVSPPEIRSQLREVFRILADLHFPENWDDLLPKLLFLLQSKDLVLLNTALDCLMSLVEKYSYKDFQSKKGKILSNIINETFPQIFTILTQIPFHCEDLNGVVLQAKICKFFFRCTRLDLPSFLLVPANFEAWLQIFVQLFTRPITNQPEDLDDRLTFPPWQLKKRVIKILHQIYNNCSDNKGDPTVDAFSTIFRQTYAIQFQLVVLQELAQIRGGAGYIHPRVIAFCIKYLIISIQYSISYKSLTPHLQVLLQEIIFPIMFFDEAEQESWDQDPEDYIRSEHDVLMEYHSTRKNVENFLCELFRKRSKKNMLIFMEFIIQRLNSYQKENADRYPEKYAALTVFCTLAAKLKALEEFNKSLEQMLAVHVYPEFTSPAGFLRARACWTFSIFSDIEFSNPQLFVSSLECMLRCLDDEDLPVRVTAAIGLRSVIQHPLALNTVKANLEKLFEALLKLMTEIDNEELIATIQLLISRYKGESIPYAKKLLESFVTSFIRIVSSDEDENFCYNITSWECLKGIMIVIEAIKHSPEIFAEVEPIVLYPIRECFTDDYQDFIGDFLKIISKFCCFAPSISDQTWELVPLISQSVIEWAIDFLPEILVCFDNLICADPNGFVRRNYIEYIIAIYKAALNENVNEKEQKPGTQLMESALQNSLNSAERYIPIILETTLARLRASFEGYALPILLYNIIGTCLFFYAKPTINYLMERNCLDAVFQQWFHNLPRLTRIYDRKVSVLAFTVFFSVPSAEWPAYVQSHIKQLIVNCLVLLNDIVRLRTEKAAQLEAKSATNTNQAPADTDYQASLLKQISLATANAIPSAADGYDSDEDVAVNSKAVKLFEDQLSFLSNSVDDSNVLENEDDVVTAIDSIEELVYFFDELQEFSQREPQLFQGILNTFSPQETSVLNTLNELCQQANAE